MSKKYKVGIIGAGGVGLNCAAFLSNSCEVVLKTRRTEQAEKLNKSGISVQRGDDKKTYHDFTATTEARALKGCDVLIITVKSYDTESVLNDVKEVLDEDTEVVTIQNGLEAFSVMKNSLPDHKKKFKGLTFVGSVRTDDTSVRLGVLTLTVIDSAAQKAGEVFRASEYDFEASDDIDKRVWDKMALNTGQNALGAITGLNLEEMSESEECIGIAKTILEEFELVANAEGVQFYEPLMDKLIENWTGSKHHPSMWQDLQSGKRTEIDAINGAIVDIGNRHGIDVPYNRMITSLIKILEK